MPLNTTQEPALSYLAERIKDVRTVCMGSAFVKDESLRFLPNPVNKMDDRSDEYRSYLQGALLDDWARLTQKTMLGKMNLSEAEIDLPSMGYVQNNIDGDGMSLGGWLQNSAKSILEAKYECWLIDYRGLASLDVDNISREDAEKINPRPLLKRFKREQIVKEPYYRMVNGKKQLAFIMFNESTEKFDPKQATRVKVDSYLVLAIDDEGYYYQQRVVNGGQSEPQYILKNGQKLKSIPLIFASDEEIGTELPTELGFLSGIVDIVLTKYQNSANKSRFLKKKVPTDILFTGADDGISEDWHKAFNLLNGGSENQDAKFELGGLNVIPGTGAKFESVSSVGTLDDYFKEDESLENRARQLGAVIAPNEAVTKTATESLIDEATRNAVMLPLVASLEDSIKWVVAYFALFTSSTVSEDNIAEYQSSVDFTIDRSFAVKKVTVEEARFMFELFGFPALTGSSDNPEQAALDAFTKWLESNGYGNIRLLIDA